MTSRNSQPETMTPEAAAEYIQALMTGQEPFDLAQFTVAIQVIGEIADQNPQSPVAGLYALGLQLAAGEGLSPTFVGGKVRFVPTLSESPQATAQSTSAASSSGGATTTTDEVAPAGGLVNLPTVPPIPPEDVTQTAPPSPIGVPSHYTTPGTIPTSMATGSMLPVQAPRIPPRYYQGDEIIPATLDPSEIRRIQQDLERAGILKPNTYQPGFWDQASREAYFVALAYANQSGDPVQTVLNYMATLPKTVTPAEVTAQEVRQFVPSDPATLVQDVKSVFRQRLGREPTPAEVRQLAANLAGNEELAYDAETGVLRDQMAAVREQVARDTAAAAMTTPPHIGPATTALDLPPTPNAPVTPNESGITVLPNASAAVDPVARFLEEFDRRYGPEMARNVAVTGYGTQRQNVMQSLLTMQSMIGGT